MKTIGLICNIIPGTNPPQGITNHLFHRAVIMNHILNKLNCQLFLYCPTDINFSAHTARGCFIKNNQFIRDIVSIPTTNGNWLNRAHQVLDSGIGHKQFIEFTKQQQINLYPTLEFLNFSSNKFTCYNFIKQVFPKIQPYTEMYNAQLTQIQSFFNHNDLIFLKPIKGNKGEKIISIERTAKNYYVTYHAKKQLQYYQAQCLNKLLNYINAIINKNKYIIQTGIKSIRHQNNILDLRMNLMHDHQNWHSPSYIRLGASNSYVANIAQGGDRELSMPILSKLFSQQLAASLLKKIQLDSTQLATKIAAQFTQQIPEIGFDYLISADSAYYLIEINSGPGLLVPKGYSDPFQFRVFNKNYLYKETMQMVKHNAFFLYKKLQVENLNKTQ